MRLTSSLTNRIFVACTLLATMSLGFAFSFVNERASVEAEAELRRGLAESGMLVDENRATLTETFTRLARLVADLPKLKAAVETGDPPTVQPLAAEYLQQIHGDLVVLTGRRGLILGSAGAGSAGGGTAGLPADVYQASTTAEISMFWPHPRGLLQVISVPIFLGSQPPEILGRLTVGFFLDDRRAVQLKRLTGSDIAFAARGQVLASTLPAALRPQLAPAFRAAGIVPVTLGGEEFLALSRPLLPAETSAASTPAETPVALILRSRTERLRFLSTIRTGLAGALVVTLLLATVLSYAVARTMTRPLTAITNAMRHVAATGDLSRKVSVTSRPWDDEDARLLASTFNTLTDSIARFQKEASQKDRLLSLGRLSTVIAHEIRNPLMIVKASLASLRRPAATPGELREAISDIDEEVARLNRIVTEVLDFAKPIRFDLAETDVNEICRASATAAAGRRDHTIHMELDPDVPLALMDAERLRTALVNILTNAHHAMHAVARADTGTDGRNVVVSSEPTVSVRTRRRGSRVTITIRDRGVGMTAEEMTHIFDPYFTTRRGGTGLGLPIAKNIIEGLGGTITVSSRSGEGTDIQIDLPLVMSADQS